MDVKFTELKLNVDVAAQIMPLLESHREEIAHYKDIKLNVDWQKYFALSEAGVLVSFFAMDGCAIIGYVAYIVSPNPHYCDFIYAVQDVLFIDKKYRGKMLGIRFLRWTESKLLERGVDVVHQHVKKANDFGPLLERLGYEEVDKIFSKRLK